MKRAPALLVLLPLAWGLFAVVFHHLHWGFPLGDAAGAFLASLAPPWPGPAGILSRQAVLLLGAAVMVIVVSSLAGGGHLAVRFLSLPPALPAIRLFLAAVFGVGLGGNLFMGLAFCGLIGAAPVVAVIVVLLAAGARGLAELVRGSLRDIRAGLVPDRLAAVLAAGTAVMLVLALPAALAPETDPTNDSLIYGLAIPARAVRLHKLVPMDGNLFFSFPALVEMVRAALFAVGGETAAHLLNWCLTAACAAALGALAGGTAGASCGWLAALLYATHHLAFLYAQISKVDSLLAAVGLACALCALAWRRDGRVAWMVAAGLLLGMAVSAKLSAGYIAVPLAGAAVFSRRAPRSRSAAVLCLGLAALLPPAPGFIRSFIFHGSPVYPLFSGAVGESALSELSLGIGQRGSYSSALERLGSLWTLSHADAFSPQWLALWPLGIALLCLFRGRCGDLGYWLGFSLTGFAVWALSFPRLHFLFPILAVAAASSAHALASLRSVGFRRSAALLGAILLGGQVLASLLSSFYAGSLRAGCGMEAPSSYLGRRFSTYADAAAAARLACPAGGRILVVGEGKSYPLIADRDILLPSYLQPFQLYPLVRASRTPRDLKRRLRQLRVTHVLHNQTASIYTRGRLLNCPWTGADLERYAAFWRDNARVVYSSAVLDIWQGWFVLYSLSGGRGGPPTLTLPGIEGVLGVVEESINSGRAGVSGMLGTVERAAGDFAVVRMFLGRVFLGTGAARQARDLLAAADRQGLMSPGLLEDLVMASIELGEDRQALRYALKLADGTNLPGVPAAVHALVRRGREQERAGRPVLSRLGGWPRLIRYAAGGSQKPGRL